VLLATIAVIDGGMGIGMDIGVDMDRWHHDLAIREVIDSYAIGIDRRDWDLVRRCFTVDCATDYGPTSSWTSREPFMEWLEQIHRQMGPTMHRITNYSVHVDGSSATATSYFDALLKVDHAEQDLRHVVGTYSDSLRLTETGWKISARRAENFLWRRGRQKEL